MNPAAISDGPGSSELPEHSTTGSPDRTSESDTLSGATAPTSFGVFKPVGHLMVGLPTQAAADALMHELHDAGWAPADLLHFAPRDSIRELEVLVDRAGAMSGFGSEITLLRRYLTLAREGQRWLLVKVDGAAGAQSATDCAQRHGATLAVWYRRLTVEELL